MKFFKFMASAAGRQFTFVASVSAAVGGFCVCYVPHSFGTSKYREIVTHYHQGIEKQLTKPILDRLETALNVLKVHPHERNFIHAFCTSEMDTRRIGSLKTKFGANVGIPANYAYTEANDIDKASMLIKGEPIDWKSKGGKLLEEALVLKDDEQIFGIAREILYMRENNLMLESLYSTFGIFIYYLMTHNINSKLNMFYRPLSLRLGLYGICSFFAYGLYALAADFHQVNLDGKVDEILANSGEKLISAGYRFYDKLLKKNMAIRELTGDQNVYTATGNENYYFRNKTLPLFLRKQYFELRGKELKNNISAKVEPTVDAEIQQAA